jgi:hypothetical protein
MAQELSSGVPRSGGPHIIPIELNLDRFCQNRPSFGENVGCFPGRARAQNGVEYAITTRLIFGDQIPLFKSWEARRPGG